MALIYELVDKKIIVFGPNSGRPLVHVSDIANACIHAIKDSSELISGEVYNVGDNNLVLALEQSNFKRPAS